MHVSFLLINVLLAFSVGCQQRSNPSVIQENSDTRTLAKGIITVRPESEAGEGFTNYDSVPKIFKFTIRIADAHWQYGDYSRTTNWKGEFASGELNTASYKGVPIGALVFYRGKGSSPQYAAAFSDDSNRGKKQGFSVKLAPFESIYFKINDLPGEYADNLGIMTLEWESL